MKRIISIIILLASLSSISGYLLSRATWIGRLGIGLFHRDYNFLKIWWQGAGMVFGVLFVLLIIQGVLNRTGSKIIQVVALCAAIAGLYFSYDDFRHDLSHRLLGERFHIGVYLFWIGWMMISIFYLTMKRKAIPISANKTDRVIEQSL
ncbi:MAG: hypothetical protein WCG87_04400 [Bacteroidota bacterium]